MRAKHFKAMRLGALRLLVLMLIIASQSAIAGIEKMDESDPRIHESRVDKFISVFRTTRDGNVHVTVNPEVGYWSQDFGCPGGDKPIRYGVSGFLIIRSPEGSYYYETGDKLSKGGGRSGGIETGNGLQKWRVTGLSRGSEFELVCPLHEGVVSTRYVGINQSGNDGLIPEPRCEKSNRGEVCHVLSLAFKSRLANEGWTTEHSFEGHQDLVRRFNDKISNPDGEELSKVEEETPEPVEESATEVEQPQPAPEERARLQALAVAQRLDEDDPRIDEDRGETFVRVSRTAKGNQTIVTAKAPLGHWSQSLDGCPGGDRPNGVRLSGHVLFWTENPLAYYEESESSISRTSGEYLNDVLAKGNWRVTGLADSSYVILDCPRRDDAMTTEYQVIEGPNDDGLIPYPGCRIESERERCSVLDSKLVSDLADNGWTTSHSVDGHSQLVDEYNKRIRDSGRGGPYIQSKMRFAKANTMLWYISYFVSIMMCIIVIRNWR